MSEASVQLVLDEGHQSFRSREPIRGQVHVTVHQRCHCERLTIDLRHVLQYGVRSDIDRWLAGRTLVEGVTWDPGRHILSFEIPAPGFPPSYQGSHVTRTWRLDAAMKLAGEPPVTVHQPFQLLLRPDAGLVVVAKKPADRDALGRVKPTAMLVTAAFVLVGLSFAGLGWFADSWTLGIIGIVVGVLAALFFPLAVLDFLARRRVGNVQIHFPETAGGYREHGTAAQECEVWTLPGASIARIEVAFVASEVVLGRKSADYGQKSYETEISTDKTTLTLVSPGVYRGPIPLTPTDVTPYSSANIRWTARVTIHGQGSASTTDQTDITVLPAIGAGSPTEAAQAASAGNTDPPGLGQL